MKERIPYLNYMRAIAAVAVVVLHVASNNWYGYVGTPDWNSFTVYLGLTRFCVPLFVMISGALFLQKEREIHLKKLFLHNIGRLLIFLAFWSMVYQMYHLISQAGGFEPGMLLSAVKNILKGQTQVHLWFLYMMIGLYIICPVVKVFTDHATRRQLEYVLLLYFIFSCLLTILNGQNNKYLDVFSINLSKLGVSVVSGYAGYFVLGHYLSRYPLEKTRRYAVYLLGILSMVFTVGATYFSSVAAGTYVELYLGYITPNVFFMSAAVFVAVSQMKGGNSIGHRLLELIADCSFGIYGVHMLFVFFFWKAGIDTFCFPGIISVPVIAAAVLILSMITVKALKLIPKAGSMIT